MKAASKEVLLVVVVFGGLAVAILAPVDLGTVFGVGIGLGGLALAWYGGTMAYTGHSLRNQGPDSTVHATDGEPVHIEGTARAHEETLTAPVTNRECFAHTYAVQAKWGGSTGAEAATTTDDAAPMHDSGGNEPTWTDVAEGTEIVPFEVETDGGTVLVEGEPTLKIMDDRTRKTVGSDENLPEGIAAFVENPDIAAAPGSSIDLSDVNRDRTLRFTETLVVPGETVFVMGVGESTLGDSGDRPVDACVKSPDEGLTARLPDRLWRYDFYVADKPMDETARAMRWVGALALVTGTIGITLAGFTLF